MSRTVSTLASRGELLDVATAVAWRFRAYGSYGGNQATAIRAIRRRRGGFTARQYANAFTKTLELYDVVQLLVNEHADEFWAVHNRGDESWPKQFDRELSNRCSGFRRSTLRSLVGMTFYYWHMR